MYAELLIFPDALRNQPLFPDEARALVAQATDAFPINPLIFNRQADGKTVQGCYGTATDGEGWGIPPAVCFGASRGCIRLVGLGPEGVALVINEAPALGSAVAMHLGNSPYTFKTLSGDCTLERSHPRVYRVRQLAVSKKLNAINAHKDGDAFTIQSVEPLIRRAVLGGLLGQARFLDDACAHGNREAAIGTDDMVGLRVLDGKAILGRIKKDAKVHALIVRDLVISLDLDLGGPWYAGHLRSRGYGLIRKEVL
ncbi:hypothetical protein [Verminephrobacter eiseniae]|uniref:hypothetical protein n=1 Tax=Verminephrobacter eiseniae TaxID=364317 RepID=UPI002238B8B3|nr:hypothetical protein [Verminephrobacter eiseniae]